MARLSRMMIVFLRVKRFSFIVIWEGIRRLGGSRIRRFRCRREGCMFRALRTFRGLGRGEEGRWRFRVGERRSFFGFRWVLVRFVGVVFSVVSTLCGLEDVFGDFCEIILLLYGGMIRF